ncbi:hypothetical protein H257_07588 [Aphanomyces astaci]|uniref:Uncharacterized protein n=1 Tax=Aphanomyces astaci TaxID=112090 RepID=W4GGE3_APHAT|nr:hypothetical protein H257_07588 [Aphanomyces astaci]ETV78745.1 hypothetical protein H257_07588 [Aphanomyces astaci]|eukprot:XP_009831464.1 hypothetical protein H257_07588 [Aphanomyces astaci]
MQAVVRGRRGCNGSEWRVGWLRRVGPLILLGSIAHGLLPLLVLVLVHLLSSLSQDRVRMHLVVGGGQAVNDQFRHRGVAKHGERFWETRQHAGRVKHRWRGFVEHRERADIPQIYRDTSMRRHGEESGVDGERRRLRDTSAE